MLALAQSKMAWRPKTTTAPPIAPLVADVAPVANARSCALCRGVSRVECHFEWHRYEKIGKKLATGRKQPQTVTALKWQN